MLYGASELIRFETETKLSSTQAALVLGIAYTAYIAYKNDRRPPEKQRVAQNFLLFSIQSHLLLPKDELAALIKLRLTQDIHELEARTTVSVLHEYENRMKLTYAACADILGRNNSTYMQHRAAITDLPAYIIYSIEAHMKLPRSIVFSLLHERLSLQRLYTESRKKIKTLERLTKSRKLQQFANTLGMPFDEYTNIRMAKAVMPYSLIRSVESHEMLPSETILSLGDKRASGSNDHFGGLKSLLALEAKYGFDEHIGTELLGITFDDYRAIKDGVAIPKTIAAHIHTLTLIPESDLCSVIDGMVPGYIYTPY